MSNSHSTEDLTARQLALAGAADLLSPEHEWPGECVIFLTNGGTIRTDSFDFNEAGSSYVRVCDPYGDEIAYWTCDEWAEEPQSVMGAILGAAKGAA